jgi:hypothetical protein
MKAIFGLFISLFFSFFSFSQSEKPGLTDSCSTRIFTAVSYFWKNDSLGTNGFRLYTFNELLKCEPTKLPISYVFEKLGNPNNVREDETGAYYFYFYFDGRNIPKEANLSLVRLYICYKIKHAGKYVEYVFKGHDD